MKVNGPRILVRPVAPKEVAGKIVLPQMFHNWTDGEVIGVGTGLLLANGQVVPIPVKIGDRVAYQTNTAVEYLPDDKGKRFFLDMSYIVAVL